MGNVTTLQPRTHAVRRALERYASLHPAAATPSQVDDDLKGFITDMLVDLYNLAHTEGLDLHILIENARKQATKEGLE